MMLTHGYVCHDFLNGVVVPIVKDESGDVSSVNNYRPLTLSSTPCQLFERCLFNKFSSFLVTDDRQFGFKKDHSTSHAMYCLKKCVDYFVENGSRVFVSFMDCSKAFDRVNHGVLFNKLIARGLPLCFVQIIVYWYSNLSSKCRWGDIMGDSFLVPSGVRQGGILSPYLFSNG